jgi:cyanate permease
MHESRDSQTPWVIIVNTCLMAFAGWAPTYCVPPMEYIIKEEFLLTHAQASLVFAGPILMVAVVGLPGGLIADRIGARRVIGVGAIIMMIGTILRGTATSASSLMAFTFIYGAGLGLSFPNLPKILSGWVSRQKIGLASGMYSSAMLAGEALAVAVTIPLVFPITYSLQGSFLMWSIPLVAATISWWALVKEPPQLSVKSESISAVGTNLRQVLSNKNLWFLASIFLILCFFFSVWIGWSPTLLMLKGATPDLAGRITSIALWVGIPAALFMPRLSYKLGLRKPFLWGGMITLAISAWIAIDVSLPLSWPLMVVSGIALNSMIPIIFALPVEMIPGESVGTASGLVISIGMIGAVIGPLISGRILDLTGNLDLSLLVLISVSAVAAGIAFRLPETGTKAGNK